jgi:predicted glycosyltransferase
MSARPSLLFYCQHSLGLGHLTRSLALCAALAGRFRVALLSGGSLPDGIAVPDGVELVPLPPLGLAADRRLVSEDARYTVAEADALRQARILAALRRHRPDTLVIELFPFGRKKFAGEIVPLLEAARALPSSPVIACSLRDILVSRGEKQARHDERAAALTDRFFDVVLVHSDPCFARFEESLTPGVALRTPIEHTGFVTPPRARPAGRARGEHVVVSAGGGRVGGPLLRAALGAHELLGGSVAMKLVAGPFLAEDEWLALARAAEGRRGLELVRSVPDLEAELAVAAGSVSQCGYNTALELLSSGAPGLVVPFAEAGEDEQTRRARRLEALGALRVLDPAQLTAERLAAESRRLGDFVPRRLDLDTGGAARSTAILGDLVGRRWAA